MVGSIVIYYLTYIAGGADLTGKVLGIGYNIEVVAFIVEMFLFYCILIPLIINGISTYITDKNKLIISFIIVIFIGRIFPSNNFLTASYHGISCENLVKLKQELEEIICSSHCLA